MPGNPRNSGRRSTSTAAMNWSRSTCNTHRATPVVSRRPAWGATAGRLPGGILLQSGGVPPGPAPRPDHRADIEEPSPVSAARPAAVIVLAAGEGTRMKSPIPQTLHLVYGRPMLGLSLAAAAELAPPRLIDGVRHGGEQGVAKAREQGPGAVGRVQDHAG